MAEIVVVVDSRIWLPPRLPRALGKDLRAEFTYSNPDFFKKKAMGYATWGVPRQVKTADTREDKLGKRLTLPRGATKRLREIAANHDVTVKFMDRRTSAPADFPPFRVSAARPELELRWYQRAAVEEAVRRQQGVIRAPTGSGKTIAALAFIAAAGERALVIMRDGNLLKQWLRFAQECLGLREDEVGIIRGGKAYRPGRRLTLALQQSLYKKGNRLDELLESEPFGAVVVDEVQTVAARTFQDVIDRFPCKYRIGFSADETRKDKKEFLIYDSMGEVIYEVSRDTLESEGVVHPVTVRVVPTNFAADWYRGAEAQEKDFTRLIEEMIQDPERNEILLRLAQDVVAAGETPALVFTHRREHAHEFVAELRREAEIQCGLLLGGTGEDARQFAFARRELERGDRKIAIGTFNAIGQGINLPVVRAGICATPISKSNRQFFGQVRGRICRTSEGKDDAVLYYLWDREVFPKQLRNLASWNDGRVEVLHRGRWVPYDDVR